MSKLLFITLVLMAAVAGSAQIVVDPNDTVERRALDERLERAEARLARAHANLKAADVDVRFNVRAVAPQRDLADARADRDRLVAADADDGNRRRAAASADRLDRSLTDLEASLRSLAAPRPNGSNIKNR
ncbi:MAG: hypothetical protein Q8O67_16560 [Deltaproteobacteria bacterium]|nr:hypothetical protein [Deltaproteobacteria bacterium]